MRAMTMISVPNVSTGQSKFNEQILSMRKKKKTQNAARVENDPTKYYRATYVNPDGTQEDEVFISSNLQDAFNFASGINARGRTVEGLQEFEELIDALL